MFYYSLLTYIRLMEILSCQKKKKIKKKSFLAKYTAHQQFWWGCSESADQTDCIPFTTWHWEVYMVVAQWEPLLTAEMQKEMDTSPWSYLYLHCSENIPKWTSTTEYLLHSVLAHSLWYERLHWRTSANRLSSWHLKIHVPRNVKSSKLKCSETEAEQKSSGSLFRNRSLPL